MASLNPVAHNQTRPPAPTACKGPQTALERTTRLDAAMLPGVSLHADNIGPVSVLGYGCSYFFIEMPRNASLREGICAASCGKESGADLR